MFSERTQVLLSKEQRARIERIAAERQTSVGAVIREAIDCYTGPRRRSRREALDRLLAIGAPVADWEQMKVEIIRGASSG